VHRSVVILISCCFYFPPIIMDCSEYINLNVARTVLAVQRPINCWGDSAVVHGVVSISRDIYSRSLYLYLGQCRLTKSIIDPLKTKRICVIEVFSAYRTVNTSTS